VTASQRGIPTIRLGAATAALILVVAFGFGVVATPLRAQTFTVLYTFTGGTDGGFPYAGLLKDKAGNLYGTTAYGGSGNGTVFKVDPSGVETVLHSFTGHAEGGFPVGGVIGDKKGNLYGTTNAGAEHGAVFGAVYKLSKSGTVTVLHKFAGDADGCNPYATPVMDTLGNLYGTSAGCGARTYGIVWKVSPKGKETVLHTFTGGADGGYPMSGLLMDAAGDLYGTAQAGGSSNNGVVYKLSKNGVLRVLHSFAGGTTDGCNPYPTPAMDASGNLYGTTLSCGASNLGIVWKVSKSGTEKVLHNFAGGTTDGAQPIAGLILDAAGNLYGTTQYGGNQGCHGTSCGIVYELNKSKTLTVLHMFLGTDGAFPSGGLIRDANGNSYGTAFGDGLTSNGTVWKLTR
jgi:uncharacterized repeat protein (TIGR03803 family)